MQVNMCISCEGNQYLLNHQCVNNNTFNDSRYIGLVVDIPFDDMVAAEALTHAVPFSTHFDYMFMGPKGTTYNFLYLPKLSIFFFEQKKNRKFATYTFAKQIKNI